MAKTSKKSKATKPGGKSKKQTKTAKITKTEQRDTKTGESYDDMPYESYAYPVTHPEHQAVVAKLFGLNPPDLETARVLELGCAGGGNILPLAIDFPKAEFVGIDLSPIQIDEANAHKENLGLKNITFEAMDIMDFKKKMGEFDYIICHGVFSWVPEFVREKVLDICDKHLSKNGLACISYNVMPGWAPLRSVREMMMIHTRKHEDSAKKVEQAKFLVEFLDRFMTPGTSMHNAVQNVHQKFQETKNDSYILHEYLEANNNQYYFIEFSEMLDAHKLQYIGDSSLSLMYTGNFAPEVDQALKQVPDTITREQYIDFLSNRQFRFSIITHKDAEIKGASLDVIDELVFSCDLTYDSTDAEGVTKFVRSGSDFFIRVNDPVAVTLLTKMCENSSQQFNLTEMVDLVVKELGKDQKPQIEKIIRGNVILYIFKNMFQPRIRPPKTATKLSIKPQAYALANYQAKIPGATIATSTNHTPIRLGTLDMVLLRHVDGTNNINGLVAKMMESIKRGEITLQQKTVPIHDPKEQKSILKSAVPQMLENMVKLGVLVK